MGKKIFMIEDTVKKFNKHDLERVGLFIEMPYMALISEKKGKKIVQYKGRQNDVWINPGIPKIKCGTMDGYFDNEFRRIFKGEYRGQAAKKKKEAKGPKEPFTPVGPSKRHSCPGDYFGCFVDAPIKAFSRVERKKPKYKKEPPNPVTNPGKKGGPGYVDICLNKYPTHKAEKKAKKAKKIKPLNPPMNSVIYPHPYFHPDPYRDPKQDPPKKPIYVRPKLIKAPASLKRMLARATFMPTGPTKWLGGCKAGCFEKWPEWKQDKWLSKWEIEKWKPKRNKRLPPSFTQDNIFTPQSMAYKTLYDRCTLANTSYKMNNTNFKTYEPIFIKYLIKNIYE